MPEWLLPKTENRKEGAPSSEWRDLVSTCIVEGSRNQELTRLAGHLLRRYIDPYVVLELCRLWNQAKCCPPLPPDELVMTVNSICRREMDRRKAVA